MRYAELRRVDLETNGVELANLRGVGGLKDPRFRDLLERYRREEVFTHVSVDRELHDKHVRELARLAERDLLTGGYTVWERDFEAANFTLPELVRVTETLATAAGVPFSIDRSKMERSIDRGKARKNAIFDDLRRQVSYTPKTGEWGAALAGLAYASPDSPPELPAVDGRRRIVALFGHLLRGQTSNFRITLLRSRIGPNGEYVPRDNHR